MSTPNIASAVVGDQTFPLAGSLILQGLFATISYRLEPSGLGTKFPLISQQLQNGRLPAASAAAALNELSVIESELRRLPVERVVWSLTDLRKMDDSKLPVNRTGSSVYEYFLAADGRPLIDSLRSAVLHSQGSKRDLMLARTTKAQASSSQALKYVAGGFIWLLFFGLVMPKAVYTFRGLVSQQHAPLVWPFGIVFFVYALVEWESFCPPALREFLGKRQWLILALGFGILALWVALSWRLI